jgi:DNA-nicking Smr family endonuclease
MIDDPDDDALWRDVMEGVKPMAHKNNVPHTPRPVMRRVVQSRPQIHYFSPSRTPVKNTSGPLPMREQRKLQRHDIKIEARLDLHGMTLARAEQALHDFMGRAYGDGLRCVEIVTGRGNPERGTGQLRRYVPLWLGTWPFILHVAENPRSLGGALYVLLRRRKD